MNWPDVGKFTVRLVVGACVQQVVGNAVDHTTPPGQTRITNAMSKIGAFVIGSMIADSAGDYVVEQIDKVVS